MASRGTSLRAACNSTTIKQNNEAILFPNTYVDILLPATKKFGAKAGFEVFFPLTQVS